MFAKSFFFYLSSAICLSIGETSLLYSSVGFLNNSFLRAAAISALSGVKVLTSSGSSFFYKFYYVVAYTFLITGKSFYFIYSDYTPDTIIITNRENIFFTIFIIKLIINGIIVYLYIYFFNYLFFSI